jgi:MFS family permease
MFGMGSVYAAEVGFSAAEVSTFISAIFIGSLVCQYPIGWLSDRLDRRQLIFSVAMAGGLAGAAGFVGGTSLPLLLALGFCLGGAANPLYSLLLAYLNDYLEPDDMAAASGGLVFINGLGAIGGPILTGWLMGAVGPEGFWLFIAVLFLAIAAYALYRMTQRAATPVDETAAYVNMLPTATPVAVEAAQEWAIEQADEVDNQDVEVGNQ